MMTKSTFPPPLIDRGDERGEAGHSSFVEEKQTQWERQVKERERQRERERERGVNERKIDRETEKQREREKGLQKMTNDSWANSNESVSCLHNPVAYFQKKLK